MYADEIECSKHPKKKMVMAPIAYFWDYENCRLPREKSAIGFVQRVRDEFGRRCKEEKFHLVCDATKEARQPLDDLNKVNVTVQHVRSTAKNAADDKLKIEMRNFGDAYEAPATAVLISSDINFVSEINFLRQRRGFRVILMHETHVSAAIKSCVDEVVSFRQFCENVEYERPPTERPSRTVQVNDLPPYVPPQKVSRVLGLISDNCGGRVSQLDMTARTAMLDFACPEDARRANNRMDREFVFGRKISTKLQTHQRSVEIYEQTNTYESEEMDQTSFAIVDDLSVSPLTQVVEGKLQSLTLSRPPLAQKSFQQLGLTQKLIDGVYAMGFSQPSKIQEQTLPILLANPPQNLIAQSQSGTGKTAAFVLTMLQRTRTNLKVPQCLCLAPTYELAVQIGKVVEEMGKFLTGLRVGYAVQGGKRVIKDQIIEEQIIIGTPGTVMDWVIKLRVIDPTSIRVFVLDEADVMISQQGHQDQSVRIHRALTQAGNNCQMLLFSATYGDAVTKFAESIVPNAVTLLLSRGENQTLDNIKQYVVHCESRSDKFEAICDLYSGISIGNCIIFCATRASASWIAERMSSKGHKVVLLSGELEIDRRAKVIEDFKQGKYRVLVTTNVCARGIDVTTVTIVINYDLPVMHKESDSAGEPDYEVYLHRIGRTGRFGKQGIAINLVDGPRTRATLRKIETHFGRTIEKLDTRDTEALEAIEQD